MQSEYIFFRVPVGAGASHIHFRAAKLQFFPENKESFTIFFVFPRVYNIRYLCDYKS